jgi:hypothetical protein
MRLSAILWLLLVLTILASAQDDSSISGCPMHVHDAQSATSDSSQSTPDSHSHDVDSRGDRAMGFAQTKTAHHFLLKKNGGVIRVEARDAADEASRASIRKHLALIAQSFSQGDFQIPMLVHDQNPPGTEVMKRRKDSIRYRYVEIPGGAEVVISSSDPKAIAAVHKFLRFQIKEHRTGDPLSVDSSP